MAKKRKSFLAGLFWTLFTIVLIVALLFGGVCIYAKSKYDVDVVTTLKQVKSLGVTINEEKEFTERFADTDKVSVKDALNAQLTGLITYSEEDGYGFGTPTAALSTDLKLNSKQLGALVDILLSQMSDSLKFDLGGTSLEIKLIQVKIQNVGTSSAELALTLKMETAPLKENMKDFPLSLVANLIPDNIYITSTFAVNKETGNFNYSLESKSLKINGLDEDGTKSLLDTIGKFTSVDSINGMIDNINTTFANAIIGNSENTSGFAYSLNAAGVNDYNFISESDINYFVLKK